MLTHRPFFCARTESGTTGFRLSGQAADIWKLILNFALWFERYLDSETWNMKLSYRPVYQKCIYYGNQSSCLGKQGRARADGFRLETVLEEMTSTWVFVIEVHGINYCQMLDSCPDVLSALVWLWKELQGRIVYNGFYDVWRGRKRMVWEIMLKKCIRL